MVAPDVRLTELKCGSYVLFDYNGREFAGEITQILDDRNIRINAMESAGVNLWCWPAVIDEIYYDINNIKKLLPPPEPRSNRLQFSFGN